LRLIKLKLSNYRRFAGEQSLDLNEDVIALVGPNEAGKSSILAAIGSVGRKEAPSPSDTTRGLDSPAEVSALFALDPDDRDALKGIRDAQAVTRVWIARRASESTSFWTLEPSPTRDIEPRKVSLERLATAHNDDPSLVEDEDTYLAAVEALGSSKQTLPPEAIAAIESLAEALQSGAEGSTAMDDAEADRRRAQRARLAPVLFEQVRIERQPTPWRQVVDILAERIPEVAFFQAADRDLQSTYQLNEVAGDPPPALRNLCALAELDLAEVHSAVINGKIGHVERLFEVANENLKRRFQDTWRQSAVYPRFGAPLDQVLRIFVATEESEYTFPEERSDGLRWFMALHAFLGARSRPDLILLVDEAETHLHYDAQADLIDALMNQRIARQVIYTTHSVGCLPPDLGCGIRAMLPDKDAERSRITNSYWSVSPTGTEKVGYTPLLFAMGANLLALTIPRFGVVVEGPSDAILLPSLMREVADIAMLAYRIAPGLSEIAKSDAPSLSHHGGKVLALTDGDQGGRAICEKLRGSGIPGATIFDLGQVRAECTLEDLVDASVLTEAINQEMETWGIGPFRVVASELPITGRWEWLTKQGTDTGTPIERLSKNRVAQRVVDIGRNSRQSGSPRKLVNETDADNLRELHQRMCAELGVADSNPSLTH
jgi:AAA domain/AAA ATPase domain